MWRRRKSSNFNKNKREDFYLPGQEITSAGLDKLLYEEHHDSNYNFQVVDSPHTFYKKIVREKGGRLLGDNAGGKPVNGELSKDVIIESIILRCREINRID